MSQIIDMMLKYPAVLPVDSKHTEFQGYLPVNGTDYKLCIRQVNGKFMLDMTEQLRPFEQEVLPLIQNAAGQNVVQLLNGLKSLITSKTSTFSCKNFTDIYRHILSEYVELREFYISMYKCSISDDLSTVNIAHLDERNRMHDLVICAAIDENEVFKVIRHSFPEKSGALFRSSNSLKGVYEQFVGLVEKLQPFFDAIDSLDCSCWVLDPEKPTRKDCYRRIGLDASVSLIVTFDPWSNFSIPDIKFLGPERLVEDFRLKLARNVANWDLTGNATEEILKLLELPSFPVSPTHAHQQEILLCDAGECCICFSSRLNGKLPEIICQNASCEQFFHKECLYQWLISVSAKQSFNELQGQCPNCEKHISCPL